jgi:hypothetical protein
MTVIIQEASSTILDLRLPAQIPTETWHNIIIHQVRGPTRLIDPYVFALVSNLSTHYVDSPSSCQESY